MTDHEKMAGPLGPVCAAPPQTGGWWSAADCPPRPLNAWLPLRWQLGAVLASYLMGRLYLEMLGGPKILYLVFTALFLAWGEGVFRLRERCGAPQPPVAVRREAWFWALCTLAVAAALALGRCRACPGWALLFWHGFAAYWVLCRAGLLAGGRTGCCFAADSICALLVLPFSQFGLRLRTLGAGLRVLRRRGRGFAGWRQNGITLLFLALALPVLAWAAALLARADEGFARMMGGLVQMLSLRPGREMQTQLFLFLLSLPVGAYLYGLVGGAARRVSPGLDAAALRRDAERLRCMPRPAAGPILAAFDGLYLLFFAVQGGYLFGAFAGALPAGFSAAQYARQGFYELCGVLVINFSLLVLCARLCVSPLRRRPALRGLAMALMAESLLLCGTVMAKIALYVYLFGFTPRRLLSGWAVLVFAAGALLALLTLWRPGPAIRRWVWFAAASFVVLCFLY